MTKINLKTKPAKLIKIIKPKIIIKKITIFKNNEYLSEIKIGTNLVCSADVTYAKGKGKSNSDMFISSGYLDKNKIHRIVNMPLDVPLIPGDEILIKIS